jgi:hypothetical protein
VAKDRQEWNGSPQRTVVLEKKKKKKKKKKKSTI